MSHRIYVAGPMRGFPEHNIPAFRAAATRLRALGHDVVSPVEVADAWCNGDQTLHTAEEYVRRDVLAMLEPPACNAISLLHGWEKSTGARLEATIALVLGFAFFDANGMRMDKPARIVHNGGYDQAPGAVDTLDSLAAEIRAWQSVTFPHRTPLSIATHLAEEALELLDDPTDTGEMADVFNLVIGALAAHDDVAVIRAKFETLKTRTWGTPDAVGVVRHVEKAA